MPSRREMMTRSAAVAGLLAAAGILPDRAHAAWTRAAFEAVTVAAALRALGGSAPIESKDVSVSGPDIAEDGAQVQVTIATVLPGAKRLLLLVEKNPNVLAAAFDLSEAVDANFSLRTKMAQSSKVYAVALTAEGRAYFASKDIGVTIGGCGG